MSSRRSKLFNYLRLFFFLNLGLSIFVFSFWFWQRSRVSDLKSTISTLSALNIKLSADLDIAHDILTNRFFNYASSFASNVLVAADRRSFEKITNSVHRFSPDFIDSSSSSSQLVPELPPIDFSCYFEIDDVPYIKVRNKIYREGDLLLGFPVQLISPDVVQYRDKFFKVSEVVSK